ncbi:RNA 2',3'-cyclic phosphodiesterase [Paenibacillus abyssi]|uniref:RNA 2',3'-cyclic phosphodiesterase n=1 Tax=Paenibacillus abyssi TaxID=1340531 RepID=A0A917FR81_9BACL|nr:RNA 2',3'-cyclic phosphodiesterase [Paenibacillus abyssi]
MKENIRLFLGLSLNSELLSFLQTNLSHWKQHLPFRSWTHPDDWHITLHFLGNMPPAIKPLIVQAMNEAAALSTRFTLRLSTLGTFGEASRPSILWIGVKEPFEPLIQLHHHLGVQLRHKVDYTPEARPYHPHLTLARKYNGEQRFSRELLAPNSLAIQTQQLELPVEALSLFQSRLGRSPMYEVIERVDLK